jgi:glutathionylspermidine synthase
VMETRKKSNTDRESLAGQEKITHVDGLVEYFFDKHMIPSERYIDEHKRRSLEMAFMCIEDGDPSANEMRMFVDTIHELITARKKLSRFSLITTGDLRNIEEMENTKCPRCGFALKWWDGRGKPVHCEEDRYSKCGRCGQQYGASPKVFEMYQISKPWEKKNG